MKRHQLGRFYWSTRDLMRCQSKCLSMFIHFVGHLHHSEKWKIDSQFIGWPQFNLQFYIPDRRCDSCLVDCVGGIVAFSGDDWHYRWNHFRHLFGHHHHRRCRCPIYVDGSFVWRSVCVCRPNYRFAERRHRQSSRHPRPTLHRPALVAVVHGCDHQNDVVGIVVAE